MRFSVYKELLRGGGNVPFHSLFSSIGYIASPIPPYSRNKVQFYGVICLFVAGRCELEAFMAGICIFNTFVAGRCG